MRPPRLNRFERMFVACPLSSGDRALQNSSFSPRNIVARDEQPATLLATSVVKHSREEILLHPFLFFFLTIRGRKDNELR